MSDNFRLHLFGVPELLDPEGRVVKLRTRKQLAVLVYLALEARERAVSRDTLSDLLWPDADQDRARHSLAQALTVIRNAIGREAVSRGGDGVQLRAALQTDIDEFDAEDPTITVGTPLARVENWAGAEFAHWVESARRGCVKRSVQALSDRIAELSSQGELRRAIQCAEHLYEIDKYSCTAVKLLAEKLLLDDDLSGAVALLRDFVQRMEYDLKCEAPQEVVRLLASLRKGRLRPAVDFQQGQESQYMFDVPLPFVGRDRELAELDRIWHDLRGRSPQTCLITGPAGIGKTTLLRRYAKSLVARGVSVTLLACHEIGKEIPFATASDLIAILAKDPRISETDPIWLSEASRISAGLTVQYSGVPTPPPIPASSIPVRVAEAIANILVTVGEGLPVALLIDDVLFLDPASRGIFHMLFKRISAPLLCLATIRTPGQVESIARSECATKSLAWDHVLALPPLTRDQVSELLNSVGSKEDIQAVGETILRLSDGNPYFAALLLADWRTHEATASLSGEPWNPNLSGWNPPATLRRAFERLSARLSTNERELLSVLAVARRGLGFEELEVALEIASAALQRAIRCCIDNGVLGLVEGKPCFRNELHRAYIYYSLPQERRKYHHLRVARALESVPVPQGYGRQLEVGHHLLCAGLHDEGTSAVIAASGEATLRGAPRQAQMALEAIPDRVATTNSRWGVAIARSLIAQGQYREAYDRLRVTGSIRLSPDDRATVVVLRAECAQRGFLEKLETRRATADVALREATAVGDEDLLLAALQLSAEIAAEAADLSRLGEFVKISEGIARRTHRELTRALAHATRGYCNMILGEFATASAAFLKSVDVFTSLGSEVYNKRPLNGLGMALTSCGHTADAIHAFRQAIDIAERSGDTFVEPTIRANLGALYADHGRFAEAAKCVESALKGAERTAHPRVVATVFCIGASLALDLGATEQADLILRIAERSATGWPSEHALLDIATVRADYYLSVQEPESAWGIVEELMSKRPKHIIGEAGRQERLLRQYVLATQGPRALRIYSRESRDRLQRQQLAPRLEIGAFESFSLAERGAPESVAIALGAIEAHGLVGIIAHLAAMHCTPPGPDHRNGDTPARLVARLFPERAAGPVPARLDWHPATS